MYNKSNSIPEKKVPGRWITNCRVDLGELSLRENWALLSPRAVHLSSSVLAKAIIKNRDSTGAMLYSCLTPTLKSMDVSNLMMMILTMILLYMRLIAECSLGGAPYFPSMAMSSELLEVSKALNRSENATYVGRGTMVLVEDVRDDDCAKLQKLQKQRSKMTSVAVDMWEDNGV